MGDKTRIHYQQLQAISNQFQQEAEELRGYLSKTGGQVDSLHGTGWIGRGSEKFFKDMEDQVLPSMDHLISALQTTGTVINKIAKVYYQAEEEARGPFKQLRM